MRAIFFLFCLLTLSACTSDHTLTVVNQEIQEIKSTFAPDKRTAWFDIRVERKNAQYYLSGETNLPDALTSLTTALDSMYILYEDHIDLLPNETVGDQIFGVVNLSACNIRSQGKHSAELVTQATMGTPLKVYKKVENWFFIQTPDGYLGWLDAGGFIPMDQKRFDYWLAAEKLIFMEDFGFVYDEIDNSDKVSDVLSGNILLKIDERENHFKVQLPDGREGYVKKEESEIYSAWLASRQINDSKILSTAKEFLGRPYLWGGTSGHGFDCSGFTKTVFFLNGILLARDASQQVHAGKEIETDTTLKNLIPGDLLFFGRKATDNQKEKITHVALYLGEGEIIHATGSVKIESLKRGANNFAEGRLLTFVRAKRMLNSIGENGVIRLSDVPFYKASPQEERF